MALSWEEFEKEEQAWRKWRLIKTSLALLAVLAVICFVVTLGIRAHDMDLLFTFATLSFVLNGFFWWYLL